MAATKSCVIPQPVAPLFQVVHLPTKVKRWLILADLHIPYHEPRAVQAALKYGLKEKCDGALILGDLIDNHTFSRFPPDAVEPDWLVEVEQTTRVLKTFKEHFHVVIWRFGNHEQRIMRWCREHKRDMLGFLSLRRVCEADQLRIPVYENHVALRYRELFFLHGDEIRVGNHHVNPAAYALRKVLDCVLVAHCHRPSMERVRRFSGDILSGWSIGCLCSLHPHYGPVQPHWQHGFAILPTGANRSIERKCILPDFTVV